MKVENIVVIFYFLVTIILASADMVADISEGTSWSHVILEAVLIVAGLIASVWFLRRLYLDLSQKVLKSEKTADLARVEAQEWQRQSEQFMAGLSEQVDSQLAKWHLTPSERDVAFLLIKGLSVKEIAALRSGKEKTVRLHCSAIYKKSGLAGRAELSGFFLEDLLPPRAPCRFSEREDVRSHI